MGFMEENKYLSEQQISVWNQMRLINRQRDELVDRTISTLEEDNRKLQAKAKEDAKRIRRLEADKKSLNSKNEAMKRKHAKEIKKMSNKDHTQKKTINYLRHKVAGNKIADMMSQTKLSTRSIQNRNQNAKFPPNDFHSQIRSIKPPHQQEQPSQDTLFGDNLENIFNSGTQQEHFGTPNGGSSAE